jgi:hypothetical protein
MPMDSSADKQGLHSSVRKGETSRHGANPAPATSPVPGAFGKEGPPEQDEPAPPPTGPDARDEDSTVEDG